MWVGGVHKTTVTKSGSVDRDFKNSDTRVFEAFPKPENYFRYMNGAT